MIFAVGGIEIPFCLSKESNIIISNTAPEELFDDIYRVYINDSSINLEKVGDEYLTIDDVIINEKNYGKQKVRLVVDPDVDCGVWIQSTTIQGNFTRYSKEPHYTVQEGFESESIDVEDIEEIDELKSYRENLTTYHKEVITEVEEIKKETSQWYEKFSKETEEFKVTINEKFHEILIDELNSYLEAAKEYVGETNKEQFSQLRDELNKQANNTKVVLEGYISKYSERIFKTFRETKQDYKKSLEDACKLLETKFAETSLTNVSEFQADLLTHIESVKSIIDQLDYTTPREFIELRNEVNTQFQNYTNILETKQDIQSAEKIVEEQNTLIQDLYNLTKSLKSEIELVTEQYEEKLNITRENLFDKIVESLESQQTETIVTIQEKVSDGKDITNDLKNFKDTFLKEIKTYIGRYVQTYGGGGGGSVSVQYADGGIINGPLNVTSQILSGGRPLEEIFVTNNVSEEFSVAMAIALG